MVQTTQAIALLEDVCVWQYDWDDVTLKLLAFRCSNKHPTWACRGTLTSTSGDQVSKLVLPGQDWEQKISPAQANRFDLYVDTRGRLVGLEKNFEFPAAV